MTHNKFICANTDFAKIRTTIFVDKNETHKKYSKLQNRS